ncbi:MAG: hypothetical protein OXF88_24925 [Rhodobacteraceae bacterium]|nr:hypothetical protein [Paracoccaceae bacterium]MCY4141367.1 hypothetical protein [Paracoccaceae bacterium]
MLSPRVRHAMVLICALFGAAMPAWQAEPQQTGPDEFPPDSYVLEIIERHPLLRQLFATEPDLAREVARRLLILEAEDGLGPASEDGATPTPGVDAPRGPSPKAVLDLIKLMKAAAEANQREGKSK